MGLLDNIKSRLGGGARDEYGEDDERYEHEYYEEEGEEYYEDEGYYNDAVDDPPSANSRGSAFNTYTPLVSMSDVRSQELPPLQSTFNRGRTGSTDTSIRTSLPYAGNPADSLEGRQQDYSQQNFANQSTGSFSRQTTGSFSQQGTGSFAAPSYRGTQAYTAKDTSDPLLQRHNLSNTGDFAATSPAYYASRSGVGHVRPAGQPRKTNRYRELAVIHPESYAEAEQVAVNLKRGNAVVLILAQTRPELAKRILDFSFGAAAALDGRVESIGERVYALTREHALTDTEVETLRNRGVL